MGAEKMARILVIDDDMNVQKLLKKILEKAGYEVQAVSDGPSAIKIARNHPPHLIISDILMPGMDGIDTMVELRREFPHLKIIAISGGGHIAPENYLKIASEFGATQTLLKPFTPMKLIALVKEMLGDN
jgi:CheY-like chemotaxis protein